ncbi:non-canonical purine NTP pyrophosphatase [archaeon]|jgi:inosine triphosphate pyrophosphatase|nr:non-canonical purine NTP pyrophosphatase [archaeon]MBT3450637.1 non-canonical purine NTP pyrophosphatase [archaeon]MBT6868783.1 non-canonical purine NTP pyrophosphatase [archaeon]MBT7192996.1 non-canonical purine NTP pyrophosphatase [archaeon]MBT7380962.1 non-canonical purine NTP pyrophosphatase [archaeon]
MTLYFITGNQGKLAEAKSILGDIESVNFDLPEIQELDSMKIIEAKLKEAIKIKEGKFFVEDTSIYLNCLNGFPGPQIKWLLQSLGNEGIYELVSKYQDQGAVAKTMIGYVNKGNIQYFSGEIKGKIVSPKGTGFGWDPIFQPESYDLTFGEMNAEEKNKISMRKQALLKMKDYLKL